MATVGEILQAIEIIAPARFALDFDEVGLHVGDPHADLHRAIVSLDGSLAALDFAVSRKAQLLVTHHPLLFHPLKRVTTDSHVGQMVLALARENIALIASHTNWDAAPGGINDTLAGRLGLSNVVSIGEGSETAMLKLAVFCPSGATDPIIDAAASAGAGEIGFYRRCASFAPTRGTYEPMPGSKPAIGAIGGREIVDEFRVELVVPVTHRHRVEAAIRAAHPYDEPAIDFFQLASRQEQPLARLGTIEDTPLALFENHVEMALHAKCLTWGDPSATIERVAVCGGAADSVWQAAQAAGAQVLVTGEVKQHVALEAAEAGFALIAAGHYSTEQPGMESLAQRLSESVPEVEWLVFAPQPGFAGRPF